MSERDTRLAEIEARLQAATAGPWTNETEDSDGSRVVSEALPPEAAGVADAMDYHSPRTHNGEFIAHARDDVPFLLAGLAAKEQEAGGLRYDLSAAVYLLQWWLRWESDRLPDDPVGATAVWLGELNSRQSAGLAAGPQGGRGVNGQLCRDCGEDHQNGGEALACDERLRYAADLLQQGCICGEINARNCPVHGSEPQED